MPTDLTDVMVRLLGRNQSPDPCRLGEKTPSLYGITASLQQDLLRIEMRFLSRSAYCCMEPACHLPMREGKRWRSLRRAMAAEGLEPPNRMRMELRMVVEEGALCFDWTKSIPGRLGWYSFRQVGPMLPYCVLVEEGEESLGKGAQ
ncbi:MAG: hypothetical protein ACK56R_04895 [Pirellulaceae bacterium]